MARTKQEIRNWLNAQNGKKVKDKSNSLYDGQCVALIKALLEFLGAPNPYAARGNAKDYGDTLLRQGIAKSGDGWLRVVVNKTMGRIGGVTYGHIWVDVKNEFNIEQNGAKALHTTKGTRPYSQRGQVFNLDKYIKADPPKSAGRLARRGSAVVTTAVLNVRDKPSLKGKVVAQYKAGQKFNYDSYQDAEGYRWLSYVSYSGHRRYVAQGKGKTAYVKGGV